jgi:hypothetical protein
MISIKSCAYITVIPSSLRSRTTCQISVHLENLEIHEVPADDRMKGRHGYKRANVHLLLDHKLREVNIGRRVT